VVLAHPRNRRFDHIGQLERIAIAPSAFDVEAHVKIVVAGGYY
jgi:hypothetical protein